jgi:hypothetical protein
VVQHDPVGDGVDDAAPRALPGLPRGTVDAGKKGLTLNPTRARIRWSLLTDTTVDPPPCQFARSQHASTGTGHGDGLRSSVRGRRRRAIAAKASGLGGNVIAQPFDAPWVRMAVIADPQGVTFIASKFAPENRDLARQTDPRPARHSAK